MIFIGEAREIIIWLWLKIAARDAAPGMGLEDREPGALQESMDQRRNENCLARAGQACDAEAQGWVDDPLGKILQASCGNTGAIQNISEFQGLSPLSAPHSWR
jgi:hypothetical protein